MPESPGKPAKNDFTHLPPRVLPEDMVEVHDEKQPNETGAPAGDVVTQFMLRYN